MSDVSVRYMIDDVPAAIRFYTGLLGFTLEHDASPAFAAGRIYFLSEDGVCTVIAAGEKFEKLAENRLPGKFQASPAFSEGRLLLRSDRELFCVQAK